VSSKSNTAIGNPPFVDDIPIQTSIDSEFSIATFGYQRVTHSNTPTGTVYHLTTRMIITLKTQKHWGYQAPILAYLVDRQVKWSASMA
jgi:hypothetical protein